jgi:hypothetical protein
MDFLDYFILFLIPMMLTGLAIAGFVNGYAALPLLLIAISAAFIALVLSSSKWKGGDTQ